MADAGASDWVCISEAEEKGRVPRRTLYARVERRQLPSKMIDGVVHVRLADVAAIAAQRAAGIAPENSQGNSPAAQSLHSAHPEELHLARTRVELRKAEAEELRAVEGVRQTRDEIIAAEAERDERRKRLALETERERIEVESARRAAELTWRRQAAAVQDEARQREEHARREAARRRREAEARQETELRRVWVGEWLDDVTAWTLGALGASAVQKARDAARRVLERLPLGTKVRRIEELINAELQVDLSEQLAAAHADEERDARAQFVDSATREFLGRYEPSQIARIREAAQRAADGVSCADGAARWIVTRAARDESRLIDEDVRRVAAEQDGRRAWARVYAQLPSIVLKMLPDDAAVADREKALTLLTQLYEDRPPEMKPREFEGLAKDRLKLLVDS
ncbi:MAG: hypothetical protein IPI67_26775 [Myxococcales bacterium]|nr:hypothetical protein [Myxococcales bacterium]